MKTLNGAVKEELVKGIFGSIINAITDTFTDVKVLSIDSVDLLLNAGWSEEALEDISGWTLYSRGSYASNCQVQLKDEKGNTMIDFCVKQLPPICMVEAIISFIVAYCF